MLTFVKRARRLVRSGAHAIISLSEYFLLDKVVIVLVFIGLVLASWPLIASLARRCIFISLITPTLTFEDHNMLLGLDWLVCHQLCLRLLLSLLRLELLYYLLDRLGSAKFSI